MIVQDHLFVNLLITQKGIYNRGQVSLLVYQLKCVNSAVRKPILIIFFDCFPAIKLIMDFQITCKKSIISDVATIKHSSPHHRYNTNTINKQPIDIHTDHQSYRKSKTGRYKSTIQAQNQNNFAQISALNAQSIYQVIKKQAKREDNSIIQQLTKSLNGTWFRSTISQTCQYTASSLYTTLAPRKQSHEKKKKINPQTKEKSIGQPQYRQPNFFPARPSTSLNTYAHNLSHQRKLTNDFNNFRIQEVEGKGRRIMNQKKKSNEEGWLKGQIMKNVANATSEQKIQQKMTSRKSRTKIIANLSDASKTNQQYEFVLICKKAKLNQ